MSRREPGLTGLAALFALFVAGAAEPPSRFVSPGPDGRLVYESSARGDRVPDFSHCGYHAGDRDIPDAPVRVVVAPGPGNCGPAIQAAIDFVARLPADPGGVRGAVLLRKGRHEIQGTLRIATGGVVLRGEGDGPDGTLLVASGTDRRPLIRLGGQRTRLEGAGPAFTIVDDYVPVGARRLQLDRVDGLRAGDRVVVTHPSTNAWVAALGMDRFPPGEEGFWLKWLPGTLDLRFERVVTGLEETAVMLDVPLPQAFDARWARGSVRRSARVRPVAESGIENLRCESDFDPANPLDEQHAWDAIAVDAAENCWVRQVTCRHFAGSAVRIGDDGMRITVMDCASEVPVSELGGYRRHTFFTSGQQSLFLRCRAEDGRHDFAVGALAAGPNAFVECQAVRARGFSGPIESWATGVLYDNVNVDGAGLVLTNRESDGQGVGWAAANCVLWQCTASVVICRNPPGAGNWAIGCWGSFLGDGRWQMPNEFVQPESLYKAQLAERLGPEALARLARRTIWSDASEDVAAAQGGIPLAARPLPQPPRPKPLELDNGWLTRNGSLLTGTRNGTVWWRGNLLPARAPTFGIGVTRFVPGREGPGYTDDLDELTESMARSGMVALEHHWGLWYDRRRDDHEMVRRPDGDVWPPFYEQPWARSGRGTAWDGLSKYDLTAFNPWYFGRLDAFADRCDLKGLVLLHEAYFQHNLLEAGAHWADFPWRPANCLQETGLPEPPPYLNRKRIVLADAFYDVSHPVRRNLHRLYIRKCLDTLSGHSNVIYLTGEEYTGPLEFIRFWIDTILEWRQETGQEVLIGLSATKDVQDCILTDPVRGNAVAVIDLKYWWYASDGRLYAPEGGKNLAPRQQLRAWQGAKGRSDEQTARQVREYRNRYPGKAILCADPKANPWVVLASGGSLPALPPSTDPRLLAALPRMRPLGDARPLTLADPGREYLTVALRGGPNRIDLSTDRGPFLARRIDPRTGAVAGSPLSVESRQIVEIPISENGPTVLWLTRDRTVESADGVRQ
jgi:hypothetical protein